MQRVAVVVSALALTAAALIPEGSALRGVVRESRIFVEEFAKESSKQADAVGKELEDAIEDIERSGRRAIRKWR